ncbi:MAG: hypothetical protein EOO53_14020 [Gammaproteobacteria bacterium]|nr:MAG: hypothetical protein EOO53_14020 [Gammaproteobacteria bacterium]
MYFQQIDVTGCRIVGAITKELGHSGPKHHGLILGKSLINGQVYIAELMEHGYQVSTYKNFFNRYVNNGNIVVRPNDGQFESLQVAKRAMSELKLNANNQYDLIANNCECFVNRAVYDKSVSSQVVNAVQGVLILAGIGYVLNDAK